MSPIEGGDSLALVQSENRDVPGLKLTPAQASRFWSLGPEESRVVLDRLVDARVLLRAANGHYVLLAGSASAGRP